MTNITTASVLAFNKKVAPSDALMFSVDWEKKEDSSACTPITVQEKDVRGTISNRLKAKISSDPMKLDAEIQKPNLQRVDVAYLPFEHDTLKLHFTVKVIGNLDEPSACNNQNYQIRLKEKIKEYSDEVGFKEIGCRYAENLANARFGWRNRIGAEEVIVCVRKKKDRITEKEWKFNAYDFDLSKFSGPESIKELGECIAETLAGQSFAFFEVDAFFRLGAGQEVFPSQELVLDKRNAKEKSKYLYSVHNVAAMHSQKIGNALRTIDTWYPNASDIGPISIEPYGSVTSRGQAYRQPKEKLDFYSLLDGWIVKDNKPEVEQLHYVIAGLIRGGVYGQAEGK